MCNIVRFLKKKGGKKKQRSIKKAQKNMENGMDEVYKVK